MSGNANGASGAAQYVKLEQRLVLLAWLNYLFGYHSNQELLRDMKEAAEGFDAWAEVTSTTCWSRAETRSKFRWPTWPATTTTSASTCAP